jgi:Ni/Fe-hydrogenase subunit HybB-like protein
MPCLDKMASFLFYAMIVDFSLEALDFVHRIYESEESIDILAQLVQGKLFSSLVVIQVLIGMVVPLVAIATVKIFRSPSEVRRLVYFVSALLVQVGIFSTRWNVVIGGQLFSKSFRGLTTYKMSVLGIEGLLVSIGLIVLPFLILWVLARIAPPWDDMRNPPGEGAPPEDQPSAPPRLAETGPAGTS